MKTFEKLNYNSANSNVKEGFKKLYYTNKIKRTWWVINVKDDSEKETDILHHTLHDSTSYISRLGGKIFHSKKSIVLLKLVVSYHLTGIN